MKKHQKLNFTNQDKTYKTGSIHLAVIYKNEPSTKAKNDFNKLFNEMLPYLSGNDDYECPNKLF